MWLLTHLNPPFFYQSQAASNIHTSTQLGNSHTLLRLLEAYTEVNFILPSLQMRKTKFREVF